MALIDIIIPNWNGKQFLGICLESLQKQAFQDFETFVVDNGSTDGSVEFVRSKFPEVKVISLTENRGFAGGVNVGIRVTKGELVFLLNNDAFLEVNCLQELRKASKELPNVGFFATKMLFSEHRDVINAAGDSFGTDGRARNVGFGEPDQDQYNHATEVFGACAGAALYRRSLFENIGLFDEDFFLILEDVDLDFRAQLAGYRCYYIPTAIVYHKHSASIGRYSAFSVYHTSRNSLYVLLKNMPSLLLVKYLWKLYLGRQRLATDYIIHRQLRAYLTGEFRFFLTLIKMTQRRFVIQSQRRVSTNHINSILGS